MKASEWRTLKQTLIGIGMGLADDAEARREVAAAVDNQLRRFSTVPEETLATVPAWIEKGAEGVVKATLPE